MIRVEPEHITAHYSTAQHSMASILTSPPRRTHQSLSSLCPAMQIFHPFPPTHPSTPTFLDTRISNNPPCLYALHARTVFSTETVRCVAFLYDNETHELSIPSHRRAELGQGGTNQRSGLLICSRHCILHASYPYRRSLELGRNPLFLLLLPAQALSHAPRNSTWQTYTRTRLHTHTHAYTHARTHAYTHTQTPKLLNRN
mmetsp:Transcript_1501/g.3876  ORF Transcript_1501/g.3876 Transcript_1501/m.3876 type:complete len:200 (+) Transcript_1501:777-1376(+)